MRLNIGQEVRRNRDVAGAGLRLWITNHPAVASAHSAAPDPHNALATHHVLAGLVCFSPLSNLDVAPSQFDELAEPQRAPGRERNHQSIPLGHRGRRDVELLQARRLRFDLPPNSAATADHAGVDVDNPVACPRSLHNRAQQAVAVRAHSRSIGQRLRVPTVHRFHRDVTNRLLAESRDQIALKHVLVVIYGAGPEGPAAHSSGFEPPFGVVLELLSGGSLRTLGDLRLFCAGWRRPELSVNLATPIGQPRLGVHLCAESAGRLV